MKEELDEIWAQFREGDEQAYLKLYRSHYLGLMNYGQKLAGNRTTASECLNIMLIQLWDNRNKLPEVQNSRAYLITCLKRTIFQYHKAEVTRKNKEDFAMSMEESKLTYTDYFDQLENSAILKSKLTKAMGSLTERQKELLKLKFFDDLDYDEIAISCNITKRTAYNIIHDALKVLRLDLKSENGEDYYSLLNIVAITGLIFLK